MPMCVSCGDRRLCVFIHCVKLFISCVDILSMLVDSSTGVEHVCHKLVDHGSIQCPARRRSGSHCSQSGSAIRPESGDCIVESGHAGMVIQFATSSMCGYESWKLYWLVTCSRFCSTLCGTRPHLRLLSHRHRNDGNESDEAHEGRESTTGNGSIDRYFIIDVLKEKETRSENNSIETD